MKFPLIIWWLWSRLTVCFLIYVAARGFTRVKWGLASSSSKQLLLIFLYKHVCYGWALIGYRITLYLLSLLRQCCWHSLFHYCTTEISALVAEQILNAHLSDIYCYVKKIKHNINDKIRRGEWMHGVFPSTTNTVCVDFDMYCTLQWQGVFQSCSLSTLFVKIKSNSRVQVKLKEISNCSNAIHSISIFGDPCPPRAFLPLSFLVRGHLLRYKPGLAPDSDLYLFLCFCKLALSMAPPLPASCATVLRLFVKWK